MRELPTLKVFPFQLSVPFSKSKESFSVSKSLSAMRSVVALSKNPPVGAFALTPACRGVAAGMLWLCAAFPAA